MMQGFSRAAMLFSQNVFDLAEKMIKCFDVDGK